MVVIMMHVTLLLVSLRLNYSPPSHSEIFFLYKYAESSLHLLILQTPNKSRKKCMQRILTLFYYTNVLFFFALPKQMCKIIPSKTYCAGE